YYKVSLNEDRQCNIYDGLKYFNVITQEKYDDLVQTSENRGPVQDISWNINKLSSFHIKYALYDVLFLEYYVKQLFSFIKNNTPKYYYTYSYISDVVRFSILERREITNIIP